MYKRQVLESLTDAISEAKAKSDNPCIVIAGDWNRYKTDLITTMFPDLTVHPTGPTRGTATLDYTFTNFEDFVVRSEVSFPIESEVNKSDHELVNYFCMLERPATFAWGTHEFMKMSDEGIERFCSLIRMEDWTKVKSCNGNICLLYTSPSPRD